MGVKPKVYRPVLAELLEERTLLSGYSVNAVGRMGLNDTGADPRSPLTMDANGNLYGTTPDGGAYGNGTVFEIGSGSSTVTPLASFTDPLGLPPGPLVLDQSGNVFGTTFQGGAANNGSIFEVIKGSGVVKTVFSFSPSFASFPVGGLVADAQGNFYGNTGGGGLYGNGAIFELPAGSSVPVILASVVSQDLIPRGRMAVDAAGNLFGITNYTVFELPAGAAAPVTVANFPRSIGTIQGPILDRDGNIFGATSAGGTSGKGTLFEIVKGSASVTTLASFNGLNGSAPTVPAIDSTGNLFGDTSSGGPSGVQSGVVYKLAAGSGTIGVLANLTLDDAAGGPGVLVDAADKVYGITQWGGPVQTGRVFVVATGGASAATVASFSPLTGTMPNPGLAEDSQGNLWGTTSSDGAFGLGSLFEIDHQTGRVIDIASFNGANGKTPNGRVVIDQNGNVFGTTYQGGASGLGNVFEWQQSSGNLVSLVDFNGINGSQPLTGLARDANGNLFGTTSSGSSGNTGSIFELASGTHTFSTVATFTNATGIAPQGTLAIDSLGNIYGTTATGGKFGCGGVFELPAGTSTVASLAAFPNPSNSGRGGLVVDGSGNVFGTTLYGGISSYGSVYEVAKESNTFSTIVSFSVDQNGETPYPDLIIDAAGNLYGSLGYTISASATIFEVPAGTTSATILVAARNIGILDSFVLDPDGTFRGVTSAGQGKGYVFEAVPGMPTLSLRRDPDQLHIDWTIGSHSGTLLASDAGGLNIAGDGGNDVISLDYSNGNPLPHVLHLNGTFTIRGLAGDNPLAGTTLEIGKSATYLAYAPGSELALHVRQYLQNGYDQSKWTGFGDGSSGAIKSFNALPGFYGVGFADSADGAVVGQPANTVEIKYTVMGDTNLDGVVNSLDAITMTRNYLSAGPLSWDKGDFNFDGSVDVNDATILQKNYNRSVATAPAVAGAVVTPVAVPAAPDPSAPAPIFSPVTAPSPSPEKGHAGSDDRDGSDKKRGKGKSTATRNLNTRDRR